MLDVTLYKYLLIHPFYYYVNRIKCIYSRHYHVTFFYLVAIKIDELGAFGMNFDSKKKILPHANFAPTKDLPDARFIPD